MQTRMLGYLGESEGGGIVVLIDGNLRWNDRIELYEREGELYPREIDSLTKQGMKRVSVEPKQRYTRPLSFQLIN